MYVALGDSISIDDYAGGPGREGVAVGTVYDPSDGTGDDALRGLAGAHGIRLADIHGRFLGHGLSAGNVTQPDPRPENQELWHCHVIEPSAWGASAVRAAFWEAIQPVAADSANA